MLCFVALIQILTNTCGHDAGKAWKHYITQTTYLLRIHIRVLILSLQIIWHYLLFVFQI